MAKQPQAKTDPAPDPAAEPAAPAPPALDLEALAKQLDTLAEQATAAGEAVVAKKLALAAKSARHAQKLREARAGRVGGMVAQWKAAGKSAEEIVALLLQTKGE